MECELRSSMATESESVPAALAARILQVGISTACENPSASVREVATGQMSRIPGWRTGIGVSQ